MKSSVSKFAKGSLASLSASALLVVSASSYAFNNDRQVDVYKDSELKGISFGTELVINATPETIWATLVDIDNYAQWNVFTPRVETSFEVGSPITLYVRLSRAFPNSLLEQKETVAVFEENSRMCWRSELVAAWNFNTFRCLEILTNDEGKTVLRNSMRYEGVSWPALYPLTLGSVMDGFEDLSVGLKGYLENN